MNKKWIRTGLIEERLECGKWVGRHGPVRTSPQTEFENEAYKNKTWVESDSDETILEVNYSHCSGGMLVFWPSDSYDYDDDLSTRFYNASKDIIGGAPDISTMKALYSDVSTGCCLFREHELYRTFEDYVVAFERLSEKKLLTEGLAQVMVEVVEKFGADKLGEIVRIFFISPRTDVVTPLSAYFILLDGLRKNVNAAKEQELINSFLCEMMKPGLSTPIWKEAPKPQIIKFCKLLAFSDFEDIPQPFFTLFKSSMSLISIQKIVMDLEQREFVLATVLKIQGISVWEREIKYLENVDLSEGFLLLFKWIIEMEDSGLMNNLCTILADQKDHNLNVVHSNILNYSTVKSSLEISSSVVGPFKSLLQDRLISLTFIEEPLSYERFSEALMILKAESSSPVENHVDLVIKYFLALEKKNFFVVDRKLAANLMELSTSLDQVEAIINLCFQDGVLILEVEDIELIVEIITETPNGWILLGKKVKNMIISSFTEKSSLDYYIPAVCGLLKCDISD